MQFGGRPRGKSNSKNAIASGRITAAIEQLEQRLVFSVLPTGFSEAVMASGLTSPTAMEFSPDGKLFVAEQGGTMEVWQNGKQVQANFFANTPITTSTVVERGLLGIAFDPKFSTNRFVYVYYTTTATDHHNRVSRFSANATGDLALAGSEDVIMELDAHGAGNHNGGAMHFGPDGMLYIATGDNATGINAQTVTNRHGKILRIDLSGDDFPSDTGQDYKIPTGQPTSFRVRQSDGTFVTATTTGVNRSIWALGLRNPFTFAFQNGTGRLFINDVGQNTWEEIDEGAAGKNYGWSTTEGDFTQTTFPDFTRPFYTYDHDGVEPNGYAITGGTFYNPTTLQFPTTYAGDYFFADFGSNKIWNIDLTSKTVTEFASDASAPVDLKVDAAGNLYYLARTTGQVMRVSFGAQPPSITTQPASQSITVGTPVTFTVAASGASPFTYQWQRAETGSTAFANITGATAASFTINAVGTSDNADQFRVIVRDTAGRTTTSNAAILTVTANHAPVAGITITSGLRNTKWDAGTKINFSGTATDQEQGNLPASAYTWKVDYLTTINGGDADGDGLPGVTRPFVPAFSGVTTSSFTPATTGPYTLTDVAYVVTLTVTDSGGLKSTKQLVVNPNTVTLTVATNPAGRQITVDGQPFNGPYSFGSVVGFQRPIGAPTGQTSGSTTYNFASWSDGGAATHTINTPTTNTTYTATFNAVTSNAFNAKVNFQNPASAGYPGYAADTGLVYGGRGNGFTYGWNADNSANTRNRNFAGSPDERYDTLIHMNLRGTFVWEIAVPNGTYAVHVAAGDPSFADTINNLNIEGTILNDPDGKDNFDEYNTVVNVTDGRLTVSPATGASAKLLYIDIASTSGSTDTTPPTVTSKTPAASATVTSSSTNVDVTFSEAVKGVDVTDLVLTGTGAAGAVKSAPINVGGNTWRFGLSGLTNGAVNVSLAPDANDIEDLAGNDLAKLTWAFNVAISQTTGFTAKVNFQNLGSQGYPGYLVDIGYAYADRGNGFTYGWSVDNTADARNRNNASSPDERYDTFIGMQNVNPNVVWEIAVPNGTYNVHIGAGEPNYIDSINNFSVEGVAFNDPDGNDHWDDITGVVTVTDGKLSVTHGVGAVNAKIDFIDITASP